MSLGEVGGRGRDPARVRRAAEAALAEELGERRLDEPAVTAYWMAAPEPLLLLGLVVPDLLRGRLLCYI